MGILPLTPGLLISMAIRADHSFGLPPQFFPGTVSKETLITKQIKLIRAMALKYRTLQYFIEHNPDFALVGTDMQISEEMLGKGYYKPEHEGQYRAYAGPTALREAIQIATDVVSYAGPQPILELTEDMQIGDDEADRPYSKD